MVVGVVVAAAAAAAAAAAVMSGSLVAAVAFRLLVASLADLQRKHGTGIKGVGRHPSFAADFTSGPSC